MYAIRTVDDLIISGVIVVVTAIVVKGGLIIRDFIKQRRSPPVDPPDV